MLHAFSWISKDFCNIESFDDSTVMEAQSMSSLYMFWYCHIVYGLYILAIRPFCYNQYLVLIVLFRVLILKWNTFESLVNLLLVPISPLYTPVCIVKLREILALLVVTKHGLDIKKESMWIGPQAHTTVPVFI